jgi:hypothetical protein
MRAVLASLVLGALVVPCLFDARGAALAQQAPSSPSQSLPQSPSRSSMRQACGADFQKFCADVHPGSGHVAQCLLAHRDELSPACRDVLVKVGAEHAPSDAGKPQ